MSRRSLKWFLAVVIPCSALFASLLGAQFIVVHRGLAASVVPVSIGTVQATFYPNPNNSGTFDPSVLSTPSFAQQFPVIDFNPPVSAQVNCSNPTGINESTRPFTDVVPNPDGTCSLVVAQGNSVQAGVSSLYTFQAVFTANLSVANAGQVTFNFFSDDGWILSSGPQLNGSAQPTYVSGSLLNAPASGYQTKYPVVGAYNIVSAPTQNTVTVSFPSAGTYPIEVDYTECCDGPDTLVMGTSFGNPIPPAPTQHNHVVIFLQGISSSLTTAQISNQIQSGHGATAIVGMGYVPAPTLNGVLPPTTQYFEYSYEGSGTQTGNPIAYNCQDTFSQPVYTDITLLQQQIFNILATEPAGTDTDFYLVGHSLGGAIALGYLDFLEQRLLTPLPSTAHLKAVITLDAPLGGVTAFYGGHFILDKVYGPTCSLTGVALTSPSDLQTVDASTLLTTAADEAGFDPQGASASFLVLAPSQSTLPSPLPSNEDLVEKAQTDLGTSVLAIGNQNDFLWNLGACIPGLQHVFGDIRDAQYVEDGGDGSGTYGRFTAPEPSTCAPGKDLSGLKKLIPFNHTQVLYNQDAQTGIIDFLTPTLTGGLGGTSSPLTVNPYQ
jgi:hypothetical protein